MSQVESVWGTLDVGAEMETSVNAITVTSASQEFAPEELTRKEIDIQNNDPAGIIYVAFGEAATAAKWRINPGNSKKWSGEFCPTESVSIIGSIASNANVVLSKGLSSS